MNKNTKVLKIPLRGKIAILSIAVLGGGVVGTMALLTDTSTTNISITSATLGLTVNDKTEGDYYVDFDTSNMKPGDKRLGEIVLKNESTIGATVSSNMGPLTGFTSSLKDNQGNDFVSESLEKGEEKSLILSVELPGSATEPPAEGNLSLTFDSIQEKN